ncbi:uncharacterized protein LOC105846547 isoform X2 [Hydra vulgaris]|uniref:Uncharacterized protein LOC105846547 isoform X2 n=1 Tax=Hydra vulgaris TaxID=6087 RepID=A0ABM4CCR4_HYDVU
MMAKELVSLKAVSYKQPINTKLIPKPKFATSYASCKNSLLVPSLDKSFREEGLTKNIFSSSYNEARNLFVRNTNNQAQENERPRSRTWTQGQTDVEKSRGPNLSATHYLNSTNLSEIIRPFKSKFDQKSKSHRKLNEIVGKILKKNLDHWHYDPDQSRKRCTTLSEIIETTIKTTLNVRQNEYKVIVIIFISAVRGDGMKHASKCCWDSDTDLFVTEAFRREDLIAVANVFATLNDKWSSRFIS